MDQVLIGLDVSRIGYVYNTTLTSYAKTRSLSMKNPRGFFATKLRGFALTLRKEFNFNIIFHTDAKTRSLSLKKPRRVFLRMNFGRSRRSKESKGSFCDFSGCRLEVIKSVKKNSDNLVLFPTSKQAFDY